MPRLLLRDALVVNAEGRAAGDILVHEGRVVAVGPRLPVGDARVLDAGGLPVLPGGVDPHVHFSLETGAGTSGDDFASGSRAALAGGTTTVIDFVTPARGQGLLEAFGLRRAQAVGCACDYGLHMGVTDFGPDTAAEMRRLAEEEGVTSFKVYLAYLDSIGVDDRRFLQVLQAAAGIGALVTVHAEHGEAVAFLRERLRAAGRLAPRFHPRSRPPELEAEAVNRALLLARLAGAPLYVVHVSTRQGAAAIAAARRAGQRAYGETCPQYLVLDQRLYRRGLREAACAVCSPPLRPPSHGRALWRALQAGGLQTVATDHCPFAWEGLRERQAGDFTRLAGGLGGVEWRLSLLHTHGVAAGRFSLERMVELVSAAPARLFGLYPRKGVIRPGADADLVVWDPGARWTVTAAAQWQRCDHTVYEGMELVGRPRTVIAGGRVAFSDGRVTAGPGGGRYLRRGPPAGEKELP